MSRPSLDDLQPTERLGPYHEFEPHELQHASVGFGTPPSAVLSFERTEAVARARASRQVGHGDSWNDHTWLRPFREATNEARMSADEACFWLALGLNTPFMQDGPVTDLAYIDAIEPLDPETPAPDIVAALLAQSDGDDDRLDVTSRASLWGRFLVAFRPYLEVLGAVFDLVLPYYAGDWVASMGPPPPGDIAAALAAVDRFLQNEGSEAMRGQAHENLLATIPHPTWISALVESQAELGAMYSGTTSLINRVTDPAVFRRLCALARDTRSHPWEEDVVAWVARFGAEDVEGLFDLVLRRDPAHYWEPVYALAFRVRNPDWVRVLQPLADRRKSAPIVERYLRQEGINAVEGLLRLADTRGRKRLWALEWLHRLAEDPARRTMIDARLPHHPRVADAVREKLRTQNELSPGDRAWAIIEEWGFQDDGAADAMSKFAELATPHEVAKLAEMLRARDPWLPEWRGGHDERKLAISTLALVPLPAARRELANLAELHAEDLRAHVRTQLRRIREQNGWTEQDYADLSVPDLGLDERGERSFDYGGRQIRLIVRGRHDILFIDDSTGKEVDRLPTAKKSDDPALVQQAREYWSHLKKPLVELFDEQNLRFERAMISGRPWTVAQWTERIVAHRILGHLARRLVWGARRGDDVVTFRSSPEGDAHDARFEPVDVAAFDTIELAHPANLPDLSDWTETFAELEIIQPFDQLGRRCLLEPTVEPGARLDGQILADLAVAGGWEFTGARWYRAPILRLWDARGEVAELELEYGIEVSATRRVKQHQRPQTLAAIRAPGERRLRSELFGLLDAARLED